MGDRMTQERLFNYIKLKCEVDRHFEQVARMKSAECFAPAREGDGSQHQPGNSDRMGRAVDRRLDYQKRMEPLINANLAEMDAVEVAVNALPDPLERDVLRVRYMEGSSYRHLKWREVAIEIFHNDEERHIKALQRVHDAAIEKIERMETE